MTWAPLVIVGVVVALRLWHTVDRPTLHNAVWLSALTMVMGLMIGLRVAS